MRAQYADLEVSKRKFAREIAEYRACGAEYRRRGWLLVEADFPKVTVIFAAPQVVPSAIVMGISFDYTNYDASPPSVQIVEPFSGRPYTMNELPTQLNRSLPQQEIQMPMPGIQAAPRMLLQQVQPYMQALRPDEVPFLCIAGVREYHEHPAHSGDLWELHRPHGAGRLVRLLEVISRYGVEPITGFGVQLIPQVTINFGAPPA